MVRFNENNEVIRNEEYTAILAGIQLREDISYSMEELAGLAEADGVAVAGQMIQSLERPNTATLIGKGKVEELAELCRNMEADMVIFNDELSGVQLRNLEEALEVRVIDRTILILDIFADRAVSREGKLQVELAQLQYRMPRLTGFGRSLSRLGGGIGTRGPGTGEDRKDEAGAAFRKGKISNTCCCADGLHEFREVSHHEPPAAAVGTRGQDCIFAEYALCDSGYAASKDHA